MLVAPAPLALAALLTLAASTASTAAAGCSAGVRPDPIAREFLGAWARGDYPAAAARTDAPAEPVVAALTQARNDLGVDRAVLRLGAVRTGDSAATAEFTAALTLAALGDWRYTGRLPLVRAGDSWRVRWSTSVIHPALTEGSRFGRSRALPPRAPLLAADGAQLVGPGPVVTVGLEPRRVTDRASVLATLARITGADRDRVGAALAAARPDAFVPVITLRQDRYQAVAGQLAPIPGVIARPGTTQLTPTETFARAVLGRVGEATAEVLAAAGPDYRPGDELGLSGLQAAYQARLTGRAGGSVFVRDAAGTPGPPLQTFAAVPGQPVRTTLIRPVQTAAEQALDGVSAPAALVAVRPSTGAVLAVANRPADSALNRAFTGRYPPGSTFKIVTTAALLAGGLRPEDPVDCPPTATVGGRRFHNFEQEQFGTVPFRVDFARSCNTAFAGLSDRLDGNRLRAAAAALGFDGRWTLPLPADDGGVPEPADRAELAAAMIGQGQVIASPLGMALVAAAVADGSWRPPILVTDPPPAPSAPVVPMAAAVTDALRGLMRSVVTDGTGTALREVPGPPVAGKTGTAEFGTDEPPRTHAWFVGFRGDLAVAVLVEGGGVGGEVAAPLAATFFTAVPG